MPCSFIVLFCSRLQVDFCLISCITITSVGKEAAVKLVQVDLEFGYF